MPSSIIRRFTYDPQRRRLSIVFVSGDAYDYRNVPPDVIDDLRAAGSKGRFFTAVIRDRYPFDRPPRGG